jgi:hypothetical protein
MDLCISPVQRRVRGYIRSAISLIPLNSTVRTEYNQDGPFFLLFTMVTSWGKAGLLLGLAFSNVAVAEDVITSDTYFYGDSPAVYPTRMLSFPYLRYLPPSFYAFFGLVQQPNSLSSRGNWCWRLGFRLQEG